MLRLGRHGLIAALLGFSLFAARSASHRYVYDWVHAEDADRIDDTTRTWTRREEVEANFGGVVDSLVLTKPVTPSFSLARGFGRIDRLTLVIASLVIPLPLLCRRMHRSAGSPPP